MFSADDPTVASRLLEIEQGVHARLQQELGFSVVEKQNDPLSKSIALALDGATLVRDVVQTFGVDLPMHAPSGKSFLEGFATTIGPRVAMPAAWLENTGTAAAIRLFVKPHEWQHVKQFVDGASAGRWPKITSHSVLYLAGVIAHTKDGEEYVGKVEGDAYAVSASVRQFFTGVPGSLEGYLSSIRLSYNLLNLGPAMAEDVLKSHFATMHSGTCPNVTAARIVREYLYLHAGDLRGKVSL